MYAIYDDIYHQYTPNVSINIPAPWILWDMIWGTPYFSEESPKSSLVDVQATAGAVQGILHHVHHHQHSLNRPEVVVKANQEHRHQLRCQVNNGWSGKNSYSFYDDLWLVYGFMDLWIICFYLGVWIYGWFMAVYSPSHMAISKVNKRPIQKSSQRASWKVTANHSSLWS